MIIPIMPRGARKWIVDLLAHYQTLTLEMMLAWQAVIFGICILTVIPPGVRRLLGNMPSWLIGLAFMMLGLTWVWLIVRAVHRKRVVACRRAAGLAFVLWIYLALDIINVAGFRPLSVVLQVFYLSAAVAAAWCWLRCEVVVRGQNQARAVG